MDISYIAMILGLISTGLGIVNGLTKSAKADAVQIKGLEDKIDHLLEKVQKIEVDMHSVNNDGVVNSNALAVHETRLDAIESRLNRLETN